jgi:hypothetical protein
MNGVPTVQLHPPGASQDTLSFGVTPIVFVPGVMGSRIAMPSADRTWDPDGSMRAWLPFTKARQRLNRRALSPRGSSASPVTTLSSAASDAIARLPTLSQIRGKAVALGDDGGSSVDDYYGRIRNWSSVLWGFYGEFLCILETTFNGELDHPVFAFGYDWRSSAAESGAVFSAFIGTTLSGFAGRAKDVIVITHSMGGLVVRAGLASAGSLDAQIRGVIHGAQPSTGAVVLFRRFFTGSTPTLDGMGVQDQGLNQIMGGSPQEFAYNLSGASGPLQLLPNNDFAMHMPGWLGAAGVSVDLTDVFAAYANYKWPGLCGPTDLGQSQIGSDTEIGGNTVVNELVFNLGVAKDFHRNIASSWHRNTFVVLSSGLRTDDRALFGPYPTPVDPASIAAGAGSIEGDWSPIDPSALNPPRWMAPHWEPWGEGRDLTGIKAGMGDGTVPESSALCPGCPPDKLGAPPAIIRSPQHSQVYTYPPFQQQIIIFAKMLFAVVPGASVKRG